MPKLEFDLTDFVGPLAVAAVFALVLLTLSFFCINFCFIGGDDSLTIFEKIGDRYNYRFMGPRNRSSRSLEAAGGCQGEKGDPFEKLLLTRGSSDMGCCPEEAEMAGGGGGCEKEMEIPRVEVSPPSASTVRTNRTNN